MMVMSLEITVWGIMTGRHDLLHVDTNGRIDGRTDEFLFFRVDLFSRLLTIFYRRESRKSKAIGFVPYVMCVNSWPANG
jgi:hypothetical protein